MYCMRLCTIVELVDLLWFLQMSLYPKTLMKTNLLTLGSSAKNGPFRSALNAKPLRKSGTISQSVQQSEVSGTLGCTLFKEGKLPEVDGWNLQRLNISPIFLISPISQYWKLREFRILPSKKVNDMVQRSPCKVCKSGDQGDEHQSVFPFRLNFEQPWVSQNGCM